MLATLDPSPCPLPQGEGSKIPIAAEVRWVA